MLFALDIGHAQRAPTMQRAKTEECGATPQMDFLRDHQYFIDKQLYIK